MKFQRKELEALFEHRPADAIPPDWEDLRNLHRIVVNAGCERILEYGSGCSTVVLGKATEGMVVSLEGDIGWWKETCGLVARASLWDRVLCVGSSYFRDDENQVVSFAAMGGVFDLVYIDGPPVGEGEVNGIMSEAKIIVVDGRDHTQGVLLEELEGFDYVSDRDQGIFVRKEDGRHRAAYRLFAR